MQISAWQDFKECRLVCPEMPVRQDRCSLIFDDFVLVCPFSFDMTHKMLSNNLCMIVLKKHVEQLWRSYMTCKQDEYAHHKLMAMEDECWKHNPQTANIQFTKTSDHLEFAFEQQ